MVLFIDFEQAYVKVKLNRIYRAIENMNVNENILRDV